MCKHGVNADTFPTPANIVCLGEACSLYVVPLYNLDLAFSLFFYSSISYSLK